MPSCFLSELLVDILEGPPDSGPQLIDTEGANRPHKKTRPSAIDGRAR